jgi:hypothetical protein
VCSLSAGLVYPPSTHLSKDSAIRHHPANQFARAIHEAQICTASRGIFGSLWRIAEFWEDKVKKQMKVCYRFIDPILKQALEKNNGMKNNGSSTNGSQTTEAHEGDTLLDHLVKISDGESLWFGPLVPAAERSRHADPVLIRDETFNILLAGRDTVSDNVLRLSQTFKNVFRDRRSIDVCRVHAVSTSRSDASSSRRDSQQNRPIKETYTHRYA